MSKYAVLVKSKPRQIVHRTRGQRHGAITRLMSPGDLGQVLKPFVFLDGIAPDLDHDHLAVEPFDVRERLDQDLRALFDRQRHVV